MHKNAKGRCGTSGIERLKGAKMASEAFSQGFLPKAKRLQQCHMLIGTEAK